MSVREFPEWFYAVPDSRTVHIKELEAALLETNDLAAKLSAVVVQLARANPPKKEPKP